MISKGTQYLTAAGFGNIRITAASMGNALVFGALWLTIATQQAIRAAFGADGAAVIKATNAYLDGIAAQGAAGKSKAQALAALINEDPMMVCSLGLQVEGVTMPWRGMDNGGSSYADTGCTIRNNSDFEFVVRSYGFVGSTSLFGVNRSGCVALVQFAWSGRNYCILQDQTGTNWNIGVDTIIHKLVRENYLCYNNGVYEWTSSESTTESTGTFYIGKANGGSWTNPCRNDIYSVKFQDGNLNWKTFLPYKRKVSDNEYVMEWLNIEDSISSGSKVYATRYETFSEVFRNPDGTPWTPSTP